MYREITRELENWKAASSRKPLIITGARQVGKTYSVEHFGTDSYSAVVEINMQDNVTARDFFSDPHSAEDIVTYIEVNFSYFNNNEDTLLFFDEVQLCPELLTSLKYLPKYLSCDIICSGSMLGIMLHKTSSWPVGYVELIEMHPMSFAEFVKAVGIDDTHIDRVKEAIDTHTPIPEPLHERFDRLFTDYMVIGGMPEAVLEYVSNGISSSIKVCRRLANDYRVDIAHYADGRTKIKAQECFDSIPNQLAKDNKKFQYKLVKEGYNARHYDESLDWLQSAGLIIKTHRLHSIDTPLSANKELGIFKVYMFDSGILVSQFPDGDISDLIRDNLGKYKGMLYENIFAQMLNTLGITSYYYEPNTSSEIDFIIDGDQGPVPIEVKGGLHTRSKSFDNFIKRHNSKRAYRFSRKNIGISDDGVVSYLPVYTAGMVFSGLNITVN